jgi:membrane protease YdiL (CAAX protease family)
MDGPAAQPPPQGAAQPTGPAPAAPDGLRAAGGDAPQRGTSKSGPSSWPPWTAPAALVTGLVLAAIGGLVVDIPALALGVKVSSANIPPGLEIADTAVQDVAFVLAALFFAGLGGRAVGAWQFGLRPVRVGPAIRTVVLAAVAFIVFLLLWAALVHTGKEKLLETLGARQSTILLVAAALLTCVVAPISEEFLFRGFIFRALSNWRGPWIAAVLTGLLFGAVHAGSAPGADLVPLGVLGFLLCLVYRYTGSLYPCIALHSLNNSIAFASLLEWSVGGALALLAGALVVIALLALALTRAGVITPPPQVATPTYSLRPPTLEELSKGLRGPQPK